MTKRTIAIQFGYHPFQRCESGNIHSNEIAAESVRDAFASTLQEFGRVETLGITYSSAAKLRHVALAQEALCSASSDVVAINYRAAATIDGDALKERLHACLRQKLDQDDCGVNVCILDVENVPASVNFHAEKQCTQRVYQYLLPLRWLTLGDDAREWLLERPNTTYSTRGAQSSAHNQRRPEAKGRTPVVLLKLKDALLSASSRTAWNRRERRRASFSATIRDAEGAHDKRPPVDVVTSPGRFGALWRKERRCLHNFADQALRGLASPNTETVWRTIDRARSIDVLGTKTEFETEVTLVIELRGDGFLSEEVRRIVASTVAICNGWLPADFFETATRSDVMIDTPVAPEGRMYLSGARYHFQEETDDLNLFNVRSNASREWLHELQDRLICSRMSKEAIASEELWLSKLRDVQAPRIRIQLEQVGKDDMLRESQIQGDSEGDTLGVSPPPLDDAPAVYRTTLSLLRQVSGNGQWPATSEARARVIRAARGLVKSSDVRASQAIESGSFTVINEKIFDGPLPLGNELFPDLVTAIFELETELARLPHSAANSGCEDEGIKVRGIRPPSSHCAVNRNAEFTPHVDSGRGEGQSLSLIVGLGDYVGGGLVVEGKSYCVRYAPLEFDGWKQIHYTQPFQGEERFSLVWFTPEKRIT
jgi:tRNA U38,U39,U40 pseudouridine synthase TruA